MADLRDILEGIINRRVPDTTLPVGTVAAAGTYEPAFQSGSVQVKGADGAFAGFGDFQFGILLPNPSGTPSRGILIGGAGQTQIVYITDEQLPGQKGITVIRAAGDASSSGAANDDSGDLLDFAGGTLNGNGGIAKYQGGTSVHARAGDAILHGGNSTDGTPGDAVVIGGETGTAAGANVKLVATKPPGSPAYGVIRHQFNSNLVIDEFSDGSIYLYLGGGFGLAGQPLVSGGPGAPVFYQVGYTGTIVVGAQTLHFNSGILTSVT